MNSFWQRFSRRRRYDDLSVSIQEHLDERIDELMEEGMSRDEAERTARRDFGNVTLLKERSREVWQWQKLESLLVDLKHVCRRLMRSPGFAITVVLTLAIGIGANTAVFSVINSVLIRPLPYPEPQQLVSITLHAPGAPGLASFRDELRSRTATLMHMPPPVKPSEAELAAMRANAARQQQTRPFPEWQTEKLGTQAFQGILAEGTRSTQNIPAGEMGNTLPMVVVSERWFSRELGITMMTVRDDPRAGRTVVEVEELNQGDPPPSMFAPPEGYQIKEQTTTMTETQSSPSSQ